MDLYEQYLYCTGTVYLYRNEGEGGEASRVREFFGVLRAFATTFALNDRRGRQAAMISLSAHFGMGTRLLFRVGARPFSVPHRLASVKASSKASRVIPVAGGRGPAASKLGIVSDNISAVFKDRQAMGDLLSAIFGLLTTVTTASPVGPSVRQLAGVHGPAGKVTLDGYVECDIHAGNAVGPIPTSAVLHILDLGDHESGVVLEAQNDDEDYLVNRALVHFAVDTVDGLGKAIASLQALKRSKTTLPAAVVPATAVAPAADSTSASARRTALAVQYNCLVNLKPVRIVILCNFVPVQLLAADVRTAAVAAGVPADDVDTWLTCRTNAADPAADIAGGSRVVEIMVENTWLRDGVLCAQVDIPAADLTRAPRVVPDASASVDVAGLPGINVSGLPGIDEARTGLPGKPGKRAKAEKSTSKRRIFIPIASCALPVTHVQPAAKVSDLGLRRALGVPWSVPNHANLLRSRASFSFVYLPALAGPSRLSGSDPFTNPWDPSALLASSPSDDAVGPLHASASANFARLHLWARVLRTTPNSALNQADVMSDPLLSR